MADNINHPPHYKAHPSGVECIEITEHMNFNLGNSIKYIWRADLKHESALPDLKKARWYIDREIQRICKEEEKKIAEEKLEARKLQGRQCDCNICRQLRGD